jgi:2'-5' RNA ligase
VSRPETSANDAAPVAREAASRRLFLALWPDAAVRDGIASAAASLPLPPGARALPPDRYHLTLVFLGNVAPAALDAIVGAAESVQAAPFALSLDRIDGFVDSGVRWIGPSSVPRALAVLHDDLQAALRLVGVRLSPTPFVPHVTLQRKVRMLYVSRLPSPIAWAVGAFMLVQSVPGAADPYRIIGRWPLRRT